MSHLARRGIKARLAIATQLAVGEVIDRPTLWGERTVSAIAVWLLHRNGYTCREISAAVWATESIIARMVETMDAALSIGNPEAAEARQRLETLVTKMGGAIVPTDAITFADAVFPGGRLTLCICR